MAFLPRYLEKFTDASGSTEVTFPGFDVEWESSQPLRSSQAPLIGSDYGADLLGTATARLDFASERFRCRVYEPGGPSDVDDTLDELLAKIWSIGRGKLWTVDSTNARRWAFARPVSLPTVAWRADDVLSKSLSLDFVRFTPWFDEAPISASATKTASPATLEVTNHGTIAATRVQIRIQSQSAAGFSNIKVVNGANGHVFESTRDATSTNDELRLDTTVPEVTYSTDDGVNRDDDYAAYVEPPLAQKLLSFDLEPGVNELTITCSGTPNYLITVTGDAPFA